MRNMDSENLQPLKDEIDSILPNVLFSNSNLTDVLRKHSLLEGSEVELKISQNSRVIMCGKVFQICPLGIHTVSPCSHKVDCFTGQLLG